MTKNSYETSKLAETPKNLKNGFKKIAKPQK